MYELKTGNIMPRDYQIQAYDAVTQHLRKYTGPAFINGSVGSGKTIMIGMVAKRCQDVGWSCLILARQGELIDQTSTTLWEMETKNSIFSASLNKKSLTFPVVAGTEGTIARALHTELKGHKFDVLQIDECHMVDWEDVISDEPTGQYAIIINEMLKRNPKMRIIGYSGSPYRSSESIVGPFWKKQLENFDTDYLVKRGYLKPISYGFGHDDTQYDLSEWKSTGELGTKDFTKADLIAMQHKILKEGTTTQKIMMEVQQLTNGRGGVLITCAGKKHCEEAAKYLPDGSYGIVTDQMSTKKRKKLLDDSREGKVKFILQVGCLTTGVNVPIWDTIVILRNIGSLTLLTQLIGRGLRTYFRSRKLEKEFFATNPDQNEYRQELISASTAPDCLVLDYSSTMECLGELYQNPILEEAQLSKGKFKSELINCGDPSCTQQNSMYARRCIGDDNSSADGRCEYFWQFIACHKCECKNDTAARFCRACQQQLIDPNAKLTGKHYTDADLKKVLNMHIGMTRDGEGVLIIYKLENDEQATEVFYPFSKNPIAKKLWRAKFVFKHVNGMAFRGRVLACRSAGAIVGQKAIFDVPDMITHRLNDKKRSVINRKVFLSGREEID